MATVEFLEARVAGKEKELEKLEKKMERIRKAEATNWEVNPYYYHERDIKYTERDIEKCKKALDEYKAQLAKQVEKDNSRDIKVILEFLEDWKARVREYYISSYPRYVEAKKEYYRVDHEFCDWFNHGGNRMGKTEEYSNRRKALKEAEEKFRAWNWFAPYADKDGVDLEKLNKDLDRDANAKYDFIIERTNDIVGQITDAENLKIGRKGDLNGYIIGTRGTAKVQTIGAGGYNIQCYHFRTLINPMK